MKVFQHCPGIVKPINLERITIDGLRHYVDDDGEVYKSVTSFLSEVSDNEQLNAWRLAVGEEEANRVSRLSAAKGTSIHLACEKYLNNDPAPSSHMFYDELFDWNILRPSLDKHIDIVVAQEIRMKSKKLRLAGTADCIACFDGVLSIIDFKTSKRDKTKEDIWSYWIQTAAYAIMAYEMWGIKITQLAIIMIVDKSHVIIHTEPSKKWMTEVIKLTQEKNHANKN